MKTLKIISISSILFIFCLSTTAVFAQKYTKPSNVEFKIKINFDNAKSKALIEKELKKEPGISTVAVNLETKVATISFDGNKTNRSIITSAIEKIGFTTELSTGDKKAVKSCSPDIEKKKEEPKK
ncbi:MAG: heavy metal-associated domain-containing protein [Bacteroidota bacterium]